MLDILITMYCYNMATTEAITDDLEPMLWFDCTLSVILCLYSLTWLYLIRDTDKVTTYRK